MNKALAQEIVNQIEEAKSIIRKYEDLLETLYYRLDEAEADDL